MVQYGLWLSSFSDGKGIEETPALRYGFIQIDLKSIQFHIWTFLNMSKTLLRFSHYYIIRMNLTIHYITFE